MRVLVGVLAGSILLLSLYGAVVEPRLIDEEQWHVVVPALPPPWQGKQVALIADLQVGMWLDNTATIGRIVDRLLAIRPALVLIAGDFIYHPLASVDGPTQRDEFEAEARRAAAAVIADATALVEPLPRAGITTIAVLGNHDYGMATPHDARLSWLAQDLEESLEGTGIVVLRNQSIGVPAPDAQGSGTLLYVAGIGSHYADSDDPAAALAAVPAGAARLVLMHNPDSFARLPRQAGPLAFAGHTHGGQVSLPGTRHWSWMALLQNDDVQTDGWIANYGAAGNHLYVNRGIGFSVVPVRISAVPEITLVELSSQPAGAMTKRIDGLASPWDVRQLPTRNGGL